MNSLSWLASFRFALCCMLFFPLLYGETAAQESTQSRPETSVVSYQNYTSLAELVTMVCDDAISKLQGFFGPTVIEVLPFTIFGQYQETKVSSLGVSLADQMMAMVNNDTAANKKINVAAETKEHQQKLRGSLQEMDGFLRIHIFAANVYGERLSYTTTVEMSDPIYRAMHTYL